MMIYLKTRLPSYNQKKRKIVAIIARKGVFADEKKLNKSMESTYPLFVRKQ